MNRATTQYALLGDPVAHSRSPGLHNAAFTALGIAAHYTAIQAADADVPQLMRTLADAGGGGNVTIPHKQRAAAALDHVSAAVRRTGACNTFWRGPHGLHGENTDVVGFAAAAAHHGVALRGRRALLLGAGGAAAAVLCALLDEGADAIVVCNRTLQRAANLVARFEEERITVTNAPPHVGFDLVINATSVGLHAGDPAPTPLDQLPRDCTVIDLVYAPGGTPWVRAARAAGLHAFDGEEMLLRQAVAAFRCWTGREPPVDVMRQALRLD